MSTIQANTFSISGQLSLPVAFGAVGALSGYLFLPLYRDGPLSALDVGDNADSVSTGKFAAQTALVWAVIGYVINRVFI